jgi:hypothetical protein
MEGSDTLRNVITAAGGAQRGFNAMKGRRERRRGTSLLKLNVIMFAISPSLLELSPLMGYKV